MNIRFRNAIRPWQHVFDPLYEYLLFAQLVYKSKNYSGCYNFGPINKNHVKVSEIVRIIKKRYNDLKVKYVKNSFKETRNLRLNTNKVDNILKRKNKKLSINQALKITLDWYDNYESKKSDIIKFSFKQIEFYFKNKLSFRQN